VTRNSGPSPSDASGGVASLGHNLFGSLSDGATAAATDLLNTDALLAPLASNGGRTMTCALLPGSPAVNSGDDVVLITIATDQRGRPRRSGAHVDVGAFEVTEPSLTGITRTNAAVTLRAVSDTPFTVATSENVGAASNLWNNLGPATAISVGLYEFTASTPGNNLKFFRLRWP
jgi:hypothetical protein